MKICTTPRLPTRIITLIFSFFHPPNLKYSYLEVDLFANFGNWLVLEAAHQQVKAQSFVVLKSDFFRCLATVILSGPSWHIGSRKSFCQFHRSLLAERGRKVAFLCNSEKIPATMGRPCLSHPHLFQKISGTVAFKTHLTLVFFASNY